MAELQASQHREVVYIEFRDGSRQLRLGAEREAAVPLPRRYRRLRAYPTYTGLPSGDDLSYIQSLIEAGSPLRELKVVAPDGTLWIHHLDDMGKPLRMPGGKLRITNSTV
jgi:hypothetical protein